MKHVSQELTHLEVGKIVCKLMELCTKLSSRVLALENNKTAHDLEITHLKKRVKRLEKKRKSRTLQLMRRVLNLETTKTAQANEIVNLKKRVKRLERKRKSRSYGLKILYKVGLSAKVESSKEESLGEEDASKQKKKIADIDVDEELTLVDETTKE
nr:hypothetical protein [Tanacetum cinerariifolium]